MKKQKQMNYAKTNDKKRPEYENTFDCQAFNNNVRSISDKDGHIFLKKSFKADKDTSY